MSTINLTIDNMKVEVPAGATVFWAAKKAGIDIPHLCYRRGAVADERVQALRRGGAGCPEPFRLVLAAGNQQHGRQHE